MDHAPRPLARACVALAALVALLAPVLAHAHEPYREIGVDDVEKMLGAKDVRIFDANPPELFAKSHLPGAVHVSQKTLPSRLPADKSLRLVFYCANTL